MGLHSLMVGQDKSVAELNTTFSVWMEVTVVTASLEWLSETWLNQAAIEADSQWVLIIWQNYLSFHNIYSAYY